MENSIVVTATGQQYALLSGYPRRSDLWYFHVSKISGRSIRELERASIILEVSNLHMISKVDKDVGPLV